MSNASDTTPPSINAVNSITHKYFSRTLCHTLAQMDDTDRISAFTILAVQDL